MSGVRNFKNCDSVLVTGASRGLGLQIVENLASGEFSPRKIVATARNVAGAEVIPNIYKASLARIHKHATLKCYVFLKSF